MPDAEPTNWELHRGIQQLQATLSKVMTTELFFAYQQNADRQIAEIKKEAAAGVQRHALDVERLQKRLEDQAKDITAHEEARRQDRTRLVQGLAFVFIAALLPTLIAFLRVGGT